MSDSFHRIYRSIVSGLLTDGAFIEVNARTGKEIRVNRQPISFNLDLSDEELPRCGIRKTFARSAAAEVAWFLLGTKDVSFIREYAPLWDKFVEDDGFTVAGAYGHRWREQFGRDQIADAIETLRNNPTDRRVVVMAWDPGEDGLGRPSKNVPCPLGFTLSIVDGQLNSSLMIRSSDVFVGLPYDVMGHALLMRAIQMSIGGTDLGVMSVTLAHPHLYRVHERMAIEALGSPPCAESRPMPFWTVEEIEDDPHGYVATVADSFRLCIQPSYSCKPELVV